MPSFPLFVLSLYFLLPATLSQICPCVCRTGSQARAASIFECFNSATCASSPCTRGRTAAGFHCCDPPSSTSPPPTAAPDVCPCRCRVGRNAATSVARQCGTLSSNCQLSTCMQPSGRMGFECCQVGRLKTPSPTPQPCPCRCSTGIRARSVSVRQCARRGAMCEVAVCRKGGRNGFSCCNGDAVTAMTVTMSPRASPIVSPSASISMGVIVAPSMNVPVTPSASASMAVIVTPSMNVPVTPVASASMAVIVTPSMNVPVTPAASASMAVIVTPSMNVPVTPAASASMAVIVTPSMNVPVTPAASASMAVIVTPSMNVPVTPSVSASMGVIDTPGGTITISPSTSPSGGDDGAFCVDVETAGDVYLARSRSTGIIQVDCVCPEITGAGFFDVALFAGIDSGCVENCIELDLGLGGSCLAGTTSSEGTGNVVSRCCAECGGTRDDFQLGAAGLRSCVPVEGGGVVFGDAPVGDVLAGCETSLIRGTFGVEAYCRCRAGDGSTLQIIENLDVLTGQQPGCIITCMEDIQPMCSLDEVTGEIVEDLSFELFYCCDQCGGTVDPDAKVCLNPVDPPPVCVDADQSANVYFGVEVPSVLQIDCICPMRSTTASPDILVFSGVQTDCIETCVEQSAKLNSACAAQTVSNDILASVSTSCCTFCLGNIANVTPGLIACAPTEGGEIEFGEPPTGDIVSGCETSVFLNSFGVDAYCRCKRDDGTIVGKNQGLFVFDGPSSECIKLCMTGLPPTCSIAPAALDVTEGLLADYIFCCEAECGGAYNGNGVSPACF